MITNIVTIVASGLFNAAGGNNFKLFRREFMPMFIASDLFYTLKDWWSFACLSSILFLSMGYGEDSPIRKIFGDAWGRAVWCLLVGLSISLPMLLTGHLAWYWFAIYNATCFFSGPLLKNLYQVAGDFILGSCFSCIVVIIK